MSQFRLHCDEILRHGYSLLFGAFVICTVPSILASITAIVIRVRLFRSVHSKRQQETPLRTDLGKACSDRTVTKRMTLRDLAMLHKLKHDQKELRGV